MSNKGRGGTLGQVEVAHATLKGGLPWKIPPKPKRKAKKGTHELGHMQDLKPKNKKKKLKKTRK